MRILSSTFSLLARWFVLLLYVFTVKAVCGSGCEAGRRGGHCWERWRRRGPQTQLYLFNHTRCCHPVRGTPRAPPQSARSGGTYQHACCYWCPYEMTLLGWSTRNVVLLTPGLGLTARWPLKTSQTCSSEDFTEATMEHHRCLCAFTLLLMSCVVYSLSMEINKDIPTGKRARYIGTARLLRHGHWTRRDATRTLVRLT